MGALTGSYMPGRYVAALSFWTVYTVVGAVSVALAVLHPLRRRVAVQAVHSRHGTPRCYCPASSGYPMHPVTLAWTAIGSMLKYALGSVRSRSAGKASPSIALTWIASPRNISGATGASQRKEFL